jgi:Domain of unknown function (DUF4190)
MVGDNGSVNTYPGDDPQQPDSEQPVEDTPTDEPSDTELTQPVGYWERQAAEQAAEQAREQAGPEPTTAYPQGGAVFNPTSGQAPQQNPYPLGSENPYGPYAQQPYGGQQPSQLPPPGQPAPYTPARGVAPYQPPYVGYQQALPDHPQSTLALVLGLVGLIGGFVICGLPLIVSPFAWALGSSALKDIRASQGQLGGEGKAQAGMVLGIIGTVLLILAVIAVVGFVVLLVASDTSSTGSSI